MSTISVTPFLWFDDDVAQAIERYLAIFPEAELVNENRLPDGMVFLATVRLQGQELTLLNGGPAHPHTDAFSLAVGVETQEEIDRISEALIDGGGAQGRCGWLTDAFGLSWQVVPSALGRLMGDPDLEKAGRVGQAMMAMDRLSIQGLQDAYDGAPS